MHGSLKYPSFTRKATDNRIEKEENGVLFSLHGDGVVFTGLLLYIL